MSEVLCNVLNSNKPKIQTKVLGFDGTCGTSSDRYVDVSCVGWIPIAVGMSGVIYNGSCHVPNAYVSLSENIVHVYCRFTEGGGSIGISLIVSYIQEQK